MGALNRVLLAFMLVILLTSCARTAQQSGAGLIKKWICTFNETEMPIIASLTEGERFRLQGQPLGCSYMLSYQGKGDSGPKVKVEQTQLKSQEYQLTTGRPAFIQDELYFQVVSVYPAGVRVAITHDGKYNVSEVTAKLKACFQDANCRLVCEDFSGVQPGEEGCPKGTMPVSATKIIEKFVESSRNCCLNFLNEPLVITNKGLYNSDEFLTAYYFGDRYNAPCSVGLIGPSGKPVGIQEGTCVSFSPVISYNIKSNIGDEYGSWKVYVGLDNKTKIQIPFTYSGSPVITFPFTMEPNSTYSVNFTGIEVTLKYISGCGSEVGFLASFLNQTRNINVLVGDTFPLFGSVSLIITDASCGGNSINLLLRSPALSKCPNRFCEYGETREICPWDCVAKMKGEPSLWGPGLCTKGCTYVDKCLAEGSEISIGGKDYTCSSKNLKPVG